MVSIGHHFYTISSGERETALNQLCFLDEGIACHVFDAQQTVQTDAVVPSVALYRLFNPQNGLHFYTANAGERDNAANDGYQLEGPAGYLFDSQVSGTVPLYRLFHRANGDHFYTADAAERDKAARDGFRLEGPAGYLFDSQVPDSVPLYRLVSSSLGEHFYTTDATERDQAVDYEFEFVAGYVFDSPRELATSISTPTTTELYRLFQPATDDHLYTTSLDECEDAITDNGFQYEGVACFVFPDEQPGSVPLYRSYNPVDHDHFHTTSQEERDRAIPGGWRFDGIGCYVLPTRQPGSVPLHRVYSPGATRVDLSRDRDYIKPNEKVTLRWDVRVSFPKAAIRLVGEEVATGKNVLDLPNLSTGGSTEVTPARSTTYRLTVDDCRGQTSDQETVTVFEEPKVIGFKEVAVWNCHELRRKVHIWSLSPEGGWKEEGTVDPQWSDNTSCGSTYSVPGLRFELKDGRQYQIVAVDPQRCGGENNPLKGCWTAWTGGAPIVGDDDGLTYPFNVLGSG